MKTAPILILLLLTACASEQPMVWSNSTLKELAKKNWDAANAQFKRDTYECRRDTYLVPQRLPVLPPRACLPSDLSCAIGSAGDEFGNLAALEGQVEEQLSLFKQCMESKGYELRPMTTAPMTPGPPNTRLAVESSPDGFLITVEYSRYQFIPEGQAVATACRSTLLSGAYHYADQQGHKITPINERHILLSMGRNEWTGITSCWGQVRVEWAQP